MFKPKIITIKPRGQKTKLGGKIDIFRRELIKRQKYSEALGKNTYKIPKVFIAKIGELKEYLPSYPPLKKAIKKGEAPKFYSDPRQVYFIPVKVRINRKPRWIHIVWIGEKSNKRKIITLIKQMTHDPFQEKTKETGAMFIEHIRDLIKKEEKEKR